ncbi:MAG TPA: hypothetical protein VGF69_04165 [Thermoanaerobaculia bacterium]
MSIPLLAGAALSVLLGLAHSYLGERYILIPLFRDVLPGRRTSMKRTLRFAWHITSVLAFGFAGIFWAIASPGTEVARTTLVIIAVTFVVCGVVALVGSRGRHLSWIVFFAIAALTLFAAR